ncbi:MAG: Sensor histidine kinase [Verrucomicrobiales bacterium]|nr:Sensor histidine kinase [Verrucomicrobiales bacterium]
MHTRDIRFLSLLLCLAGFSLKPLAADFTETQTFRCLFRPQVMALSDVNGDGWSDLIVGIAEGGVEIYLNSGSGEFKTKPTQVLPAYVSDLVLRDFDGDGRNDIAVAQADGQISIWRGNGDGSFKQSQSLTNDFSGYQETILVADLNGDGLVDLVSTDADSHKMLLILNSGNGGFSIAQTLTIPLNVSVAVRSVPGHLEPEILVVSVEPPELHIWRNISGDWKAYKRVDLPRFGVGRSSLRCTPEVGDVNQDGIEDLIIFKDGVAELRVLTGKPTGGLNTSASFSAPRPINGASRMQSDHRPAAAVAYGSCGVLIREEFSERVADWKLVADVPSGNLIKAEEQPDGNRLIVAVDFYGFAHVYSTRPVQATQPLSNVFEYFDPNYDATRAPSFTSRVWGTADGLPGNAVRSIVQASDGYVWVGTTEGLARFDGEAFRRWGINSNGTVFNRSCEALAEDPKGRLWVGYLRGLMRIEGNSIAENYVTNLTDPRIFSLKFSKEGDLWISEFKGVDRFRNGVFESISHPEIPSAKPTVLNSMSLSLNAASNQMLVATSGGIFRFDTTSNLPEGKWLHGPLDCSFPTVVATGANGEIYAGDMLGGVSVLSSNGFHGYFLKSGFPAADGPSRITALACRRDGSVWVGTLGGLFVLRNGLLTRAADAQALRHKITALAFDHDDNLWAGTDGFGIVLLRFPLFNAFTTRDGLLSDRVNAVAESPGQTLWVATDTGLCTNSGTRFKPYALPPGVLPCAFSAICLRTNGEVWTGGDSGKHHVLKNTGFVSTTDFGYIDHLSFFELENKALLMISDAGVGWDDAKAGSSISSDILGHPSARNVFEDSKGGIWFGTIEGLYFYDRKTFRTNRLPDPSLTGRCEVAHEDPTGALWIISDQGLVRLKNSRYSSIRLNAGLFDEKLLSMVDDDLGNYWFGTGNGIFRVESKQLNDYADGKRAHIECIHYGLSDGMLNEQCAYGHPAACRSQNGALWFATAKGLMQIDPQRIIRSSAAPKVFFDEISDESGILYSRFAPGEGSDSSLKSLPLKHGDVRSLTFQFSSPRFSVHGTKMFEYRLKGLEKNWTQSERGKASYNYLPPGDYFFEVRAASSNGHWSPILAIPVQIQPLLTQRHDFYVVSGTLLIGFFALFGTYRRRVHRQMQVLRQRTAIAEERSRIARDLHDDIGASLTQIAMTSELAQARLTAGNGAGNEIEKVSQLARGAVENMSQIIWSTNPKFDTLSGLSAYMREFASKFLPESIEVRFDAPDLEEIHVTSEFRANIFYLLKEAIANILKHSRASKVTIKLRNEAGVLDLNVIDNGIGFTQNQRMLISTGLDSMKKRAADLHGRIEVISEPGKGTTINVSFPLRDHTLLPVLSQ